MAIAEVAGLAPELAVGLLLLAASPGGTTANLFSHLFRGDVALNVTLTAVNSVVALVTLPVVVNLAISRYLGDSSGVGMQLGKMVQVFAIVLVPVAIGMLVRSRSPQFRGCRGPAGAHRLGRGVLPRLLGLTPAQCVASGFEIGIHNSTLAIAVALTVLGNTTIGIPAAVDGIVMFPVAALFGLALRRSGVLARTDAGSRGEPALPDR